MSHHGKAALESKVLETCQNLRKRKQVITDETLQRLGKEIANRSGLSICGFGRRWARNFAKRVGLVRRASTQTKTKTKTKLRKESTSARK